MMTLITETENKEKHLRHLIRECGSVVVAYSGGVDSSLVAKVAHQELGKKSLVAIADSPSLARQELEQAQSLAQAHGFALRVIPTDEIDHPLYQANNSNRCYHCKYTLYYHLEKLQKEIGFRFLLNGDHAEDRLVHRPGRIAAEEKGVRSILAEAEFTKVEVRAWAQKLGLPNYNKPASPCLSSRIPTGTEITKEKLLQVEEAEKFLKTRYGIHNLRVRHQGKVAQIETSSEYFPIFTDQQKMIMIEKAFNRLGFQDWSFSRKPLKR